MFNRKYIFKGSIFHCYVSLPECKYLLVRLKTHHCIVGNHQAMCKSRCASEGSRRAIWETHRRPRQRVWWMQRCCKKKTALVTSLRWVCPKIGVPQNGWFIMENYIKMDDLGYPYFRKHPGVLRNLGVAPWLPIMKGFLIPTAPWLTCKHQLVSSC